MKRNAASWPFQVSTATSGTTRRRRSGSRRTTKAAQNETGDREVLAALKSTRVSARTFHSRAAPATHSAPEELRGDDAGVGHLVQGRARDRAPCKRRIGEDVSMSMTWVTKA